MSSPPTKSAPASCASRTFSPLAMTKTRTDLPRPCGRTTVPRTTWSECFGSTPRLMASSTVSLNLVWCVFLISSVASESLYGRASTCLRAPSTFFPAFFILVTSAIPGRLLFPRLPRRPGPCCAPYPSRCAPRSPDWCVEIDKLDLGNFLDLLLGDFPDLVAVRFGRALGDAGSAKQKHRSRRRLQNEGEAAVRVNGD